jgi:hypothetical protein
VESREIKADTEVIEQDAKAAGATPAAADTEGED